MERRLLAAGGAMGVGLICVLLRLVQLTVVQADYLARQAQNQHLKVMKFTSQRGAVVDRNGEPLALTLPAESLFVNPRKLPADAGSRVRAIADALHLAPKDVEAVLRSRAPFVWLKRRAPVQEAARVRALGVLGIDSRESERRLYPQGTLAAPVLGFTDVDARGIEGLELAYDKYLRGERTEVRGERDALGRVILARGVEAQPGAMNVHLTLDVGLQYIAERELGGAVRKAGALAGTVVILDPKTFEVLALAQSPTFNPHDPGKAPALARRNRAVTDVYEPGSTAKVLLAAAALDAKKVHPEERIFCELGRYRVGKYTINDHHPYGSLSFTQVLQHSSNIGAAKVGERLGREAYGAYLRAFGFGRATGIDLPGESPGLLPPPQSWARINLVTASFGQGVAATPLQLACAYAAVANGGVLMRPYVVRSVTDAEGKTVFANSPQPLWQVVREETARRVLQMMEKTVEREGTGWRAQVEGFRVAGKTGTSQKVNPGGGYSARGRIASFAGIVPADDPRLVILVVVDEPKTAVYGGEVAAPVFQAIARQALAHLGVQGDGPTLERAAFTTARREETVPPRHQPGVFLPTPVASPALEDGTAALAGGQNFLGMSLREVVLAAQDKGVRITTTGSGYVTTQSVQGGSGEPVYALTLSPIGEARP